MSKYRIVKGGSHLRFEKQPGEPKPLPVRYVRGDVIDLSAKEVKQMGDRVVKIGAPPEAQELGTEPEPEILSLSISKIKVALRSVSDPAELEALLEAESKGANRKRVLKALYERAQQLG